MASRLSILLIPLLGCSPGEPDWVQPGRPALFETDLGLAEEAAFHVEADLRAGLLSAIRQGPLIQAAQAFTPGGRVRMSAPTSWKPGADADIQTLQHQGEGGLVEPPQFARWIKDLIAGWSRVDHSRLDVDRFWLNTPQATARFDLSVSGSLPGARRAELRMAFMASLELTQGTWKISALEVLDGLQMTGPGPRFVEITAEAGLHYGISAENRSMLAGFTDRQRTLALGGLSAVDINQDGYWDLLGTRRGQLSVLFENDGMGGFQPRPFPGDVPRECGSFLLMVDLEGDGPRELVSSEPLRYEGDRAWCGIWRESGDGWTLDPKALSLPNPVGLRRLSIQTIVPCDVQGDGRLDLFLAVYGSATSRGEDYNTVEAHDGADNHLFIQQPDGTFLEESEARGISGTQYTYVAKAFDFDGDGDLDIFEGNDFGPNVLWLNDGSGHFTADDTLGLDGVPAYTMGVALTDLTGEGRWSLYLSNMSSSPGQRIVPVAPGLDDGMRGVVETIASGNQLYTQAEDGRWLESAGQRGIAEAGWAWGCVFWDPDGDGDPDLFVTNGFTSHSDPALPDWQSWYWRQVVDDAEALQEGRKIRDVNENEYRASSFNGYERDRLYIQTGSGSFLESAWLNGLDMSHDGRCALPVDIDGDGDQDLALWTLQGLRLFENRSPPTSFLRLTLRATASHPAALGAVVKVKAGDLIQRTSLRLTEGFQTQVPGDLHFSFGPEPMAAVEVEVQWPSGTTQAWSAVPTGGRVLLVEGDPKTALTPLASWPPSARPRPRPAEQGGAAARHQQLAHTVVQFLSGEQAPMPPPPGRDTVTHTAIHLDRPLDFRQEATIQACFPGSTPSSPALFVFDGEGKLRRAFHRNVEASELALVLDLLGEEPPFSELLVLSGREATEAGRLPLAQEYFQRAIDQDPSRADACEGLGRVQMILERPDLAEPAYARAVAIDPDYALGHYNLGVARMQLGRHGEAIEPLEQSLRVTGPRHGPLMTLAEAAFLAGRSEEALEAWAGAARANPSDPEPLLNRAKLLGRLSRLEEARQAFMEVLESHPERQEARLGLARVEAILEEER